MTRRTASRLAWSIFAFCVLCQAAALLLPYLRPEAYAAGGVDVVFTTSFLLWGLLGAILVMKAHPNAIGWLFVATALGTQPVFLAQVYATVDGAPGAALAGWFQSSVGDWVPPFLVVLLLLLFPTGKLRTRLERFTFWLIAVATSSGVILLATRPGDMERVPVENPFGVGAMGPLERIHADLAGPVLAVAFGLSAFSMFRRLRRSQGVERQQLKWFFLATSLLAGTIVLGVVTTVAGMSSDTGDVIGGLAFLVSCTAIPIAVTVAILRYKLFEIDLIINRALVYAVLSAFLIGAYLLCVVGLQLVLAPFTRDSDVAVAASTLAVAALFRPLRARVQSFIDRRFYRRKYDAAKSIERFSSRLREEVELHVIQDDVLSVVGETVQPTHVGLWLAGRGVS